MSDVKVACRESLRREEVAAWLHALAKAFSGDGKAELPIGPGTVSVRVPDRVQAEFEVEVDGSEVEIELEFTWSTAQPAPEPPAGSGG